MDPEDVLEALIIDRECSNLRLKRARQSPERVNNPMGANRLPKGLELSTRPIRSTLSRKDLLAVPAKLPLFL